MARRLRRSLPAAALLAGLLAPAAAPAATVTTPDACVRYLPDLPTFTVRASGFTPGAPLTVTSDGTWLGTGRADVAGNWEGVLQAPEPGAADELERTIQLAAADAAGTTAGPVPVRVARLTVVLPERARPRSRVAYRAAGFTEGRPVFLHVRRGGRTLQRALLGRARGACGMVTRQLRYLPVTRPEMGAYEYWFTQTRRFDRDARPIVRLRVTIFRTPRAQRAVAARLG